MRHAACYVNCATYGKEGSLAMSVNVPVYNVRLVKARRPIKLAEPTVSASASAARVFHALFGETDREHFAAVFLDVANNVKGVHVVSIGGQAGIGTIDMRTVFRAAIAACAGAIVVGHNHPSGNLTPSPQDRECTRRLVEAGHLLGMPILDHVIVTRDPERFYSFLEHGHMPAPVSS